MHEKIVHFSLGPNVGDRERNLQAAISALARAGLRVNKISSFYKTEPVDLREQPWFLNCQVVGPSAQKYGIVTLPLLLLRCEEYGQQTLVLCTVALRLNASVWASPLRGKS